MALQANGRIVAAGEAGVAGGVFNFALARYNTDGSLDTSFSGDGRQMTNFGGDDRATSVAIQGNGRIIAAGSGAGEGPLDFTIARYLGG